MNKPKGLGRGLDALLGGDESPREALLTLPVGRIRPGKYQPRTKMDQQALAELAASIRSQGLMQPLLVRPVDRPLRADRGQASLARSANGGTRRGACLGARSPRRGGARSLAHRKHPTRELESDGRSR